NNIVPPKQNKKQGCSKFPRPHGLTAAVPRLLHHRRGGTSSTEYVLDPRSCASPGGDPQGLLRPRPWGGWCHRFTRASQVLRRGPHQLLLRGVGDASVDVARLSDHLHAGGGAAIEPLGSNEPNEKGRKKMDWTVSTEMGCVGMEGHFLGASVLITMEFQTQQLRWR
ncbi:hypothetical protein BRADI_2g59093v3, partial [Brachypodium distachyon]